MPHRTTPEPQLPQRGDLSNLEIEPPLLVDPNVGGEFSAPTTPPTYNPGNNVSEVPSRNPILGNRDWIKEYWKQYNPQDTIDSALEPWMNQDEPQPPLDYSHPDDDLFFSPSNEISKTYDPVSINDPNAPTITGNASTGFRAGQQPYSGNLANFGNIPGMFPNYYNAPLDSMNYGVYPNVDKGRVIVAGVDQDTGVNSGTQEAPAGPIVNQDLLDSSVPLDSSSSYNQQQSHAGGRTTARPTPQNLFGVGSQSGSHYYSSNGGQSWVPIGQAPQDARWAQNSGTGNFTADQTAKGFMGWNPADSITNNTGTTGDAGHTIFYPNASTPMGKFDPEQGWVVQSDKKFQGGRPDPRWVYPSQSESNRGGFSFVGAGTQAYNDWLQAHNQWYYGKG